MRQTNPPQLNRSKRVRLQVESKADLTLEEIGSNVSRLRDEVISGGDFDGGSARHPMVESDPREAAPSHFGLGAGETIPGLELEPEPVDPAARLEERTKSPRVQEYLAESARYLSLES